LLIGISASTACGTPECSSTDLITTLPLPFMVLSPSLRRTPRLLRLDYGNTVAMIFRGRARFRRYPDLHRGNRKHREHGTLAEKRRPEGRRRWGRNSVKVGVDEVGIAVHNETLAIGSLFQRAKRPRSTAEFKERY
jgi:hypothetical protein